MFKQKKKKCVSESESFYETQANAKRLLKQVNNI